MKFQSLGEKMEYNKAVESFRDDEYPMLKGKAYLDHAGTTIYARSLITQFSSTLLSNLYGNPHSDSSPARLSGDAIDSIRLRTLAFFHADPEHFDLVFTANATASIKLVAESFRDLAGPDQFKYYFHKDAHTSLVGVRELAGVHHCFGNDAEVEDWLQGHVVDERGPALFAYPGQSNMTGRRLPLSWCAKLRSSPLPEHQNTYSLLDAAALATTSPLDFSHPDGAPDFTAISFYKIFGFPDLGGLIIRRKSGHVLSWRRYFGGGTVDMLTVFGKQAGVKRKETSLHDALEDGTLPFHDIVALGCALDVHRNLYGSMEVISRHTLCLANRLYNEMSELRHGNGRSVCTIYTEIGDLKPYIDSQTQGSTVAFNIVDANGQSVGHKSVEQLANKRGIYLRSGALCNPGGIASHLQVQPWQFKRALSAGHKCGGGEDGFQVINGTRTGVVRASFGAMSTVEDVDMLIDFLKDTFVKPAVLALPRQHMDWFQGFVHNEETTKPLTMPHSRSRTNSSNSDVSSSIIPATVRSTETSSATRVGGSFSSNGDVQDYDEVDRREGLKVGGTRSPRSLWPRRKSGGSTVAMWVKDKVNHGVKG